MALTALPAVSAAQTPQRSAPAHHKAHRAPKALAKKPAAHRTAKSKAHAKRAPRHAPDASRVALHKGNKVQPAPRPQSGHHSAPDSSLDSSHRPYAPPAEKHMDANPDRQRPSERADKPTETAESNQVTKSPVAPTPPASPAVASPKTPVSPTPPTLPKDNAAAQAAPDKP